MGKGRKGVERKGGVWRKIFSLLKTTKSKRVGSLLPLCAFQELNSGI